MNRIWIVLSGLLIALSGCASGGVMKNRIANPAVQILDTQMMPEPTSADIYGATRQYLIGPYDKLAIEVFGVPELSRTVQADASGRIDYPLAGVVEAAGKSPQQIATIIESRLGGYVRDPQVTVNVSEVVSQTVTLDGQVGKPGVYPIVGRMTLMRAVAGAGGTSEDAKLEDVIVFRTVNGQQIAGVYNLAGIRYGNYPDPEIFANDVIVVGDSPARRMLQTALQGLPLITAPLIILTR